MRPLYLPQTPNTEVQSKPWRFWGAIGVLVISLTIAVSSFATPPTDTLDPMQDKYSKEIREEYALCRKKTNPMSQFFCTCRVLDKQCEAPRKLEHGEWNTIEFWPSNDEAQREVQFVLFADYDILGDFSPIDKGIVVTCLAGVSNFHIFVGGNVDPDKLPVVTLDNAPVDAKFINQDGSWLVEFQQASKAFEKLKHSDEMRINFINMDNKKKVLEFDTIGFDHVSKGWEKLCHSPTS